MYMVDAWGIGRKVLMCVRAPCECMCVCVYIVCTHSSVLLVHGTYLLEAGALVQLYVSRAAKARRSGSSLESASSWQVGRKGTAHAWWVVCIATAHGSCCDRQAVATVHDSYCTLHARSPAAGIVLLLLLRVL